MDTSDSTTQHVEDEVDGSPVEGEAQVITTNRIATFQGKLDLSSFGYSRTATLRSASRAPSVQRTEILDERDDNNKDGTRIVSKRRRTASTTTRSPVKRKKSSSYAPPSTYSHLPPLPDTLEAGLICVFIGLNPGIVRLPSSSLVIYFDLLKCRTLNVHMLICLS